MKYCRFLQANQGPMQCMNALDPLCGRCSPPPNKHPNKHHPMSNLNNSFMGWSPSSVNWPAEYVSRTIFLGGSPFSSIPGRRTERLLLQIRMQKIDIIEEDTQFTSSYVIKAVSLAEPFNEFD
jgi:hypothetical protein